MRVKDDFTALYKQVGFGSIRYPGGTISNLFNWKTTIGPRAQRLKQVHGFYNNPGQGGIERGSVHAGRAFHRQLQHEVAFFGNAFLAAHQPHCVQLYFQLAGQQRRLEVGRNRQRHRQQQRALKAVVGQGANADLVRHRPGDVARRHARRQRPGQAGGQARIAGIFPVGVPCGLVRYLQTHPHRLAGLHPLRRVRQQLGTHLRRGHDRIHAFLGAGAYGKGVSSY